MKQTFGEAALQPTERINRFLEEALELAQAAGVTREKAYNLLDYVYGRAIGNIEQEVGGVGVTLLAYCETVAVSADSAETAEFVRVLKADPAKFREKQNKKAEAGVGIEVKP